MVPAATASEGTAEHHVLLWRTSTATLTTHRHTLHKLTQENADNTALAQIKLNALTSFQEEMPMPRRHEYFLASWTTGMLR
ncbi:hypothetical protein RRG08_055029 [Elysia crispata]|uniref:Uncharacterized protein n=1 Tax=Elysia crispata TaxID=231223 RepID=A0AAE0XRW5_9GAST|nr:hypothetical protein RRG08_055029 [Elysia crispata]